MDKERDVQVAALEDVVEGHGARIDQLEQAVSELSDSSRRGIIAGGTDA